MGDFVQDRIANLILAVEKREVPGKGEDAASPIAAAEAPASVVEVKRPVR